MNLFQISPDLLKAFRNLSIRVNDKIVNEKIRREIPKDFEGKRGTTGDSEVFLRKVASQILKPDQKAFRIPVVVKTKRDGKSVKVSLPIGAA